MKVNFVVRRTKKKVDGTVPIEMTICVKGKRRYVSTGREVKPSDFNSKTQTVKSDKELNEFLKALKARLYAIETTLMSKDVNVSIDTVLDVFRNGEQERTMTFLQLFEIHNGNVGKRVKQKLITPTTLSKYEVTKDYVARYIKTELKKDDILIKDITPSFIDNLFVFLLGFMSNNTAIQKMKQVKRVIRFAVDEGYIKVSPYKITLKKEKKEVQPLTIKEVNAIRKKKIDIERLAKIRDLFIFECYTGLAFTDLMSLNDNDFHVDESGHKWIIKKRHKTNVVATIPLLPIALEILDKYNNKLPHMSNVKYNAYLKEIGDICGIKKNLHSHLARHTWATILLNAGMDMVSVSKCLGHSNSKITESTYAKILPDKLFEKVKKVGDNLKQEGAY
ncbi:MAG: site-specific integrase [Prevotella sp.]|nr:site-specific integrase [Prevotella sp.]